MYYIYSENNGNPYYIAKGRYGDPPRSFFQENAKVFKTKEQAQKHIKLLKKENSHRDMRLKYKEIQKMPSSSGNIT